MKYIPLVVVLGFALSLCNLTNKLHSGKTKSGSGTSSSSDGGGSTAEHGEATAAQLAALSGGQQIKWDKQGMSWTVPPNWTETSNETKEFLWRSPGGSDAANLIVSISPMGENFPTDASINACLLYTSPSPRDS